MNQRNEAQCTAALPNTGGSSPVKKRLVYIEFLRVFAIFFVIYNHTGMSGYQHYLLVQPGIRQWISAFASIFTTMAVPLFYMLTGAVLLQREEPISVVLKKRVLRFLVILISISCIYWAYAAITTGKAHTLSQFLTTLYSKGMTTPLWYLYSYLAILLMLPLLRCMVRSMTNAHFVYLGALSLLFIGILPLAEYFVFQGTRSVQPDLRPALFVSQNVVYVLMGYYFAHKLPEKYQNKKTVLIGAVLSVVAILLCVFASLEYMGTSEKAASEELRFRSAMTALPIYTLFLAAKLFFQRRRIPPFVNQFLLWMGGTVFGIYLLERILRLELVFLLNAFKTFLPCEIACALWVLCVMLIGSVIVSLLKKIPGVRKFL